MTKPSLTDLAAEVQALRQEVAALRIELAAHAGLAAKVVQLDAEPLLVADRAKRAAKAEEERARLAAAEAREKAAQAKAEREQAEFQDRLEQAEREVEGALYVRLFVARGTFSLCERNPVVSYLGLSPYHPQDLSLAEWRQALIADRGGKRGEIRDALGSGVLRIARLPDNWGAMDSYAQLQFDNQFYPRLQGTAA